MKLSYYISMLVALAATPLFAQKGPMVLKQDQVLWYVQRYHPIAIQANLLNKQGESEVRAARGAFDPNLQGSMNQKEFDEKSYFRMLGAGLTIPTWFGVDIKGGYDQNNGVFLNPENSTPQDGLWFAGVSIPLGKDLFIDKRRAALRQAKIYAESTLAEQCQAMNNLYFDAITQYWKWVETWNRYRVMEDAVALAATRFSAVKQSCLLGDIPAIDTLEAFIQLQNRQIQLNEEHLTYRNHTLQLSTFLWYENETPLEITDSLHPPALEDIAMERDVPLDSLSSILRELDTEHPAMQLYDYKLARLDVDRRLKIEGLKPQINFSYQLLTDGRATELPASISPNNYKYGLDLRYPLFVRQQRGELQLNQIEIQKVKLSQVQKRKEIEVNVTGYYNTALTLAAQVGLYQDATINYRRLLDGERKKFDMGESSLFLVNARESKLIEARLKLAELVSKYKQSQSGFLWSSGKLYTL